MVEGTVHSEAMPSDMRIKPPSTQDGADYLALVVITSVSDVGISSFLTF
jgi:hypothetical protein